MIFIIGILLRFFIFYRLNNLKYFNNKLIKEIEVDISKTIYQYFDEIISIKEKMEKQKESILKDEENNNDIDEGENNDSIFDDDNNDINKNEEKINFFNYAKFNLSVCIDEIIRDEENKEDE